MEEQVLRGAGHSQFMAGIKRPIILVDWSALKANRSWLVLRAALWTRGAAMPIYESVHPLRDQNSPGVERTFLTKLKSLLPEGLRPIIVTDAGFPRAMVYLSESTGLVLGGSHPRAHVFAFGRRAVAALHGRLCNRQFASSGPGRTTNDPLLCSADPACPVSKAAATAPSIDSVQATQAQ